MNTGTVVIGLVLIVIGVFFGWILCFGIVIIPVGFIVMLIGLVQKEEPATVVQYYGSPPLGYSPSAAHSPPVAGPPGSTNFCQYCGRQLAPDAAYCPGCGKFLKKQP